ncbi:MAG: anti-sigma factor [Litoreibacter sp.]
MTQYQEKLSAFLDGELSEGETREIEIALEQDVALQAELETLIAADAIAKEEFATVAKEPIPFAMVQLVQDAQLGIAANSDAAPSKTSGWFVAMVAAVALAVGATGGYFNRDWHGEQVASVPGWLSDIADYHAVYADQKRHLVEVPASEGEHIKTWLSATVGEQVDIPDLSEQGLQFQGARLLVAAGKPVAQLMYLDSEQRVVALCQIQTATPRDGFAGQSIGAFDMVSWGNDGSNFVIVGDQDRDDLNEIARAAAAQI